MYKLVTSYNSDEFERQVNDLLEQGYRITDPWYFKVTSTSTGGIKYTVLMYKNK